MGRRALFTRSSSKRRGDASRVAEAPGREGPANVRRNCQMPVPHAAPGGEPVVMAPSRAVEPPPLPVAPHPIPEAVDPTFGQRMHEKMRSEQYVHETVESAHVSQLAG